MVRHDVFLFFADVNWPSVGALVLIATDAAVAFCCRLCARCTSCVGWFLCPLPPYVADRPPFVPSLALVARSEDGTLNGRTPAAPLAGAVHERYRTYVSAGLYNNKL